MVSQEAMAGVGVLILIAGLSMVVAECTMGCRPAESPSLPAYCTEEAAYTAKLLRCVDAAETLAESKACRERVDVACGIIHTKAGQR